MSKGKSGAPEKIRTSGLTLRRRSLYPAELRARLTRILHFGEFLHGARRHRAIRRVVDDAEEEADGLGRLCYTRGGEVCDEIEIVRCCAV